MKTIRFYTDNDIYMGWTSRLSAQSQDVLNWIRSGNYIRYNEGGNEYTLRPMPEPMLKDKLYRIANN